MTNPATLFAALSALSTAPVWVDATDRTEVAGPVPPAVVEQDIDPRPDSAAVRDRARTLQTRFERRRVRLLPRSLSGGSHRCDEIIGRLCIWDDGDEGWRPQEEPAEIGAARTALLAELDSLGALIPGDHWIFGQRVRYLVEAGRLDDAEGLARRCGLPGRWRCDAYLGYVLHRGEEIERAEEAFADAIAAMPAAVRSVWTDPVPLLDGRLHEWLADQADSSSAVQRLWTLADPLFLAAGNDRWTGHLSRWVHAMSSEGARSPHLLRWGDDLAEAMVRYGWPVAWERSWPRGGPQSFTVTGRDHPAAFRTFPPVNVLASGDEDAVPWEIPDGHARSAHLPPFLDTLAPLDGQIGRFWRDDGVLIAASWTPSPWPARDTAAFRAEPVQAGLFVEQGGALALDVRGEASSGSTVRLWGRAPWSDWGVVSFEAWTPGLRRAHRLRTGMGLRRVPPDILSISDIVLLEGAEQPTDLAAALPLLRGSTEVASDESLGVAFEVYGLGFRSEVVGIDAWVERRNLGRLSRAVRWLGIGGPREEVSVAWEEPGPERPRPLFRAFRIGLPQLEAGDYDLVVKVSVAGRSPLAGRRSFRVR